MKHKTATLEGALLDAAVAKALGYLPGFRDDFGGKSGPAWVHSDGARQSVLRSEFSPSTDWAFGGPLIERERIAVWASGDDEDGFWSAGYSLSVDEGTQCQSGWIDMPCVKADHMQTGTTPLIAAMRAYVASTFGEEVELP